MSTTWTRSIATSPVPLAIASVGAALVGCGMEPGLEGHLDDEATGLVRAAVIQPSNVRYSESDVQSWDGSATLQANKQALVAAATKLGASDEQVRLFLAIGMAETNEMNACDRDCTKDRKNADGSLVPVQQNLERNMTAFNMNCDMLSQLGWKEGCGPDLNCQTQIEEVVKYLLAGINKFGVDGFLYFHRGGSAALADGESYGAQEYKSAMFAVAARLASHREEMTNNKRLGMAIKHV